MSPAAPLSFPALFLSHRTRFQSRLCSKERTSSGKKPFICCFLSQSVLMVLVLALSCGSRVERGGSTWVTGQGGVINGLFYVSVTLYTWPSSPGVRWRRGTVCAAHPGGSQPRSRLPRGCGAPTPWPSALPPPLPRWPHSGRACPALGSPFTSRCGGTAGANRAGRGWPRPLLSSAPPPRGVASLPRQSEPVSLRSPGLAGSGRRAGTTSRHRSGAGRADDEQRPRRPRGGRSRRSPAPVPAGAEPAVQRPGCLREPAAGARAGQGGRGEGAGAAGAAGPDPGESLREAEDLLRRPGAAPSRQ